jgi:lipoate-protein ligase A
VTSIASNCLVFPWELADGPANMARDEALLEFVAEYPSAAALRLYGWSEPTLSLGYFQPIAEAETNPRWRGLPRVRRPTGGGALLHDLEVTYAMALPRDHTVARQTTELYRRVHAAIVAQLKERGVEATRRGEEVDRTTASRPFLCFADRDPEDVISGVAKLAGSAQRRRSGAVLQHGSILIATSTITPELPGAIDLGMRADPLADWASRLTPTILALLELVPILAETPAQLLQRAAEIESSVYRSESWTRRR